MVCIWPVAHCSPVAGEVMFSFTVGVGGEGKSLTGFGGGVTISSSWTTGTGLVISGEGTGVEVIYQIATSTIKMTSQKYLLLMILKSIVT